MYGIGKEWEMASASKASKSEKRQGVDPIKDAIRALKKLRKGVALGKDLSIREMMEEGRK